MTSPHDIIRKRLLARAGIHEPVLPAPALSEIFKMQWNVEFEKLMRNRMAMGFFRYGSLQAQIGKHPYDNVGSMIRRLLLYIEDSNREHLVDVANLALVEFTVHPEKPFKPADDGVHTERRK